MFSTKSLLSMLALIGMAKAYTGEATFYTPGLGACGERSTANQHIVAISKELYGAAAGKGPNCSKMITVQYEGKSVEAKVVDKCMSCATGDIDLSPSAFEKLAPESAGRLYGVTWNFA